MADTMHYAFSTTVKLSGGFALFESVMAHFLPLQTELCYTNAVQPLADVLLQVLLTQSTSTPSCPYVVPS